MLKKGQRLSTTQFSRFFRSRHRVQDPHFSVIYTPHEHFHAAVVVPKKLSGSAVSRNRIRRRVYHTLRGLKTERNLTGVFIVLVRARGVDLNATERRAALEQLIGGVVTSR